MRGAPPETVLGLCPELADDHQFDATEIQSDQSNNYEPHPLDYDWRFLPETVSRVAGVIGTTSSPIILMGVASLERTLRNRGMAVKLLDRNPAIQDAAMVDFRGNSTRVATQFHRLMKNPVIFLDSPWYLDDLLAWINFAIDTVDEISALYFSLWPELIRPNASHEREFIVESLETFGPVRIWKDYLFYEVPLFEKLTYRQRGIKLDFCWRKGDLVELRPGKRLKNIAKPTNQRTHIWNRFLIGNRQIAIRDAVQSEIPCMQPVDGVVDWCLDSVSRRDPRRGQIDFWTSNNIVSRLNGSREFVSALTKFFGARTPFDRLTTLQRRALEEMTDLNCVDFNTERRFRKWKHRD